MSSSARPGSSPTGANIMNGGGGNDVILGDTTEVFSGAGGASRPAAVSIDDPSRWSTFDNPLVGNATTVPHATVYRTGAAAAQTDWYAVSVDAGAMITVDIDLGPGPLTIEIYDESGQMRTSQGNGNSGSGGAGSAASPSDPYLQYQLPTFPTGPQTYYIHITAHGGNLAATDSYAMQVSVAGHAAAGAIIGGGDTIDGGAGDDLIAGGDGNDAITDTQGNNAIDGGAGDDVIHAGATSGTTNRLAGGDGIDTLDLTTGYLVNLSLAVTGQQEATPSRASRT